MENKIKKYSKNEPIKIFIFEVGSENLIVPFWDKKLDVHQTCDEDYGLETEILYDGKKISKYKNFDIFWDFEKNKPLTPIISEDDSKKLDIGEEVYYLKGKKAIKCVVNKIVTSTNRKNYYEKNGYLEIENKPFFEYEFKDSNNNLYSVYLGREIAKL